MEELIRLHFRPSCAASVYGIGFSFPPQSFHLVSILKAHTLENPLETHTGASWGRTATSTLPPSWSPCQPFHFDVQHMQNVTFAILLVLCPSCTAACLYSSSCSCAGFRPTAEVPCNTDIINSLNSCSLCKTRMQKDNMPREAGEKDEMWNKYWFWPCFPYSTASFRFWWIFFHFSTEVLGIFAVPQWSFTFFSAQLQPPCLSTKWK